MRSAPSVSSLFSTSLFVGAVGLGMVGSPAAVADDSFQPELLVETLDNGLTVVIEEQHRTGDVAVHVQYKVGSLDEPAGQKGGAHLFEHLMYERSKNVPQDMFDTWVTGAGGTFNAWTAPDETAFHMRVPTGALDLALFLESDRMGFLDSALDWKNLRNQQDIVLQERAEGYSEPHGSDWDALRSAAYPAGHPYQAPTIGTVADVRAFSKERAKAFWGGHYSPDNAVLVIVGHVDAEQTLERVRHWFSDVPSRGEPPERPAYDAEQVSPRKDAQLLSPVSDWTVYLAWPTPPRHHPDEAALELLSYVLSYGRGTRLDDALYYDKRIATYSNAFYDGGLMGGLFVLTARSHKPRSRTLEKKMEDVLAELESMPPETWELERARMAIEAGLLDQMESPETRAEWWADCWASTGAPDCLDETWARYERVSTGDLVRVAKTWLTPERRVSLSVVPETQGGGLPGAVRMEQP